MSRSERQGATEKGNKPCTPPGAHSRPATSPPGPARWPSPKPVTHPLPPHLIGRPATANMTAASNCPCSPPFNPHTTTGAPPPSSVLRP
eukprot:148776-Chlamydomonas_euryale.AAC.1